MASKNVFSQFTIDGRQICLVRQYGGGLSSDIYGTVQRDETTGLLRKLGQPAHVVFIGLAPNDPLEAALAQKGISYEFVGVCDLEPGAFDGRDATFVVSKSITGILLAFKAASKKFCYEKMDAHTAKFSEYATLTPGESVGFEYTAQPVYLLQIIWRWVQMRPEEDEQAAFQDMMDTMRTGLQGFAAIDAAMCHMSGKPATHLQLRSPEAWGIPTGPGADSGFS